MTDGIVKKLEIIPGINKNETAFQGEAKFIDGDKIRFYRGTAQKIGGWRAVATTSNASGTPRAIHTWVDLTGEKQLAIGTSQELVLFRNGTQYQNITPSAFTSGLESNVAGFGWGSGPYGGDYAPIGSVTSVDTGWGDGASSVVSTAGRVEIKLTEWSLDNFGEDLIANFRGGRIYRWRRNQPSSPASVVNNSPTTNIAAVAEPAPYLVSYGTCTETGPFDPLLVRWPSLNDFTDWSASAGNDAGDFRIQGGSEILGVVKTKRETLILTDDVVYSQRFTNTGDSPFAFERLAKNSGIIGRNAGIEVNSVVYWMGNASFFKYQGTVNPIKTTLDEALFNRERPTSINFFQKNKVYAGINSQFNELIWLYPSRDSEECDRYVIYNYVEDLWYDGTIDRTTWTDGDIFELPLATDSSGLFYEHELGNNDNDNVMKSWIKTGVFDIDDGDKLLFINKFIPDVTQTGPLKLTLLGRKYPNDKLIQKGPYEFSQSTDKIDLRLRARQMQFAVSSSTLDGSFDFGIHRVNIRPDGER